MIARKEIPQSYKIWNKKNNAPFGKKILNKKIGSLLPKSFRLTKFGSKLCGNYFYQKNSKTRVFEFPWAFYAAEIKRNSKVLEIGGSLSGFQFDLFKKGAEVHNVDPGLESNGKGWPVSHDIISKMNKNNNSNVILHNTFIEKADFASESFDVIYSISVIEHVTNDELTNICSEINRILKKGGLFIATIDLFLDLYPFTETKKNSFGCNMSVKKIVDDSNLKLISGNKEELYGFKEFNQKEILRNRDDYFCVNKVLTQCIILKKE